MPADSISLKAIFKTIYDNKITIFNHNPVLTLEGYKPVRWVNRPVIDDTGEVIRIYCSGEPVNESKGKYQIIDQSITKLDRFGNIIESIKLPADNSIDKIPIENRDFINTTIYDFIPTPCCDFVMDKITYTWETGRTSHARIPISFKDKIYWRWTKSEKSGNYIYGFMMAPDPDQHTLIFKNPAYT
jgi:hypothetical protein